VLRWILQELAYLWMIDCSVKN